jgi:hypothetical protein
MKVLYTSAQVRQAIKVLFSSAKGRRVAITAFVGDSAEIYLPKPKGIELYCWPNAGGTNPNAIRELIDRKVEVFFSDSLHMKVYWAEDKGAVITSANLSTFALGAGGLKEIGVLLPPGKINIDRILTSIEPRSYIKNELLSLDNAHKDYLKRNYTDAKAARMRQKPNSFIKWYKSATRPRWKLGWYWEDDVRLSANARAVLERENGASKYEDIMTAEKGFLTENDWILCFNMDEGYARWATWMFAHHVVKVSPSDRAYDRNALYQVLQVSKLKAYGLPPFLLDSNLRQALRKAVPSASTCLKSSATTPGSWGVGCGRGFVVECSHDYP